MPSDAESRGGHRAIADKSGSPGWEARERETALQRADAMPGESTPLCVPDVPGLDARLIFTLLAENVRDYAIFLLDPDGVIRCWGESARLMKWWTRPQAEGAHLRMLYPLGGSEDGSAEAHLAAAAESGEYSGEGHRVRSDGSLFWAYVTLTALRDPDGTLLGFAKVTRDFSARRAVEAAMQQQRHAPPETMHVKAELERLRGVVSNLSHELRTPLNAIVGSIALLDEHHAAGADRRHLDRLSRNANHLLAIVNDLLQLSRAEAGELVLSPGERRLGPVLEDALSIVAVSAEERRHTIVDAVSGTAADLPYWGDETRVRQILLNLLSNAVKFTEPGGRITISAGTGLSVAGARLEGPGPWLYVRVEDTGRGIPPERLGTIFEPFEQARAADERDGSGLGLSISRQLARLMGGDVTVDSTPGTGTQFTLWLPITVAEPVPR